MYAINLDYTVDLAKKDTQVKELDRPLFFGDQNAYMLNVTVKRNNNYENLSGMTCHAYMVYEGTNTTYPLEDAGVSGSTAWAVFDEDSLLTTGRVYILVRLVDEANHFALTVFTLYGDVKLGITNTIFVPEGGILDIDALEEKIAELEGYIDEVGDTVAEAENVDISMTKSGSTITITTTNRNGQQTVNTVEDPSYEVKQKADIDAVTSPSSRKGNPIELTDAVQAPLDTLKITLEPQQDLHGYEKPWAGGAGKNLIDANTVWADFLQSDGTFLNPLGTTHWNIPSNLVNKQLTISAYAKADANNANLRVCAVVGGTNNNGTLANNTSAFALTQLTFTPTSTDDYVLLQNSGTNGTYKDIQLEIGSTATTYEPYSNICPITGYDSVDAVRTGKNLWPNIGGSNNGITVTYDNETGECIVNGTASSISMIEVLLPEPLPAGTYTLCANNTTINANILVRVRSGGQSVMYVGLDLQNSKITETLTDTITSVTVRVASGASFTDFRFKPQLELGSIATAYEPYQGQTFSVNVKAANNNTTVYGGTVTINRDGTGTLVVDKGIETITGESNLGTATTNEVFYLNKSIPMVKSLDYSKHIICDRCETRVNHGAMVNSYGRVPGVTGYADSNNSYPNQNWLYFTNGTATSKTEMSAWLSENPLTVVYTLATPQSYALTARQLQTLLGYNRITTDGTMMELTYRKDKYLPNDILFNQLPVGTASGDLATFSEGADDLPLKKLTVDIQPKQDLHGYDKPWAGGAGKNLLHPDVGSRMAIGTMSIDVDDNGVVTIGAGAYSGNSFNTRVICNVTLAAGAYIFNGQNDVDSANKKITLQLANGATQIVNKDTGEDYDFELSQTTTLTIRVGFRVGAVLTNPVKLYPMIRRATETDPSFAPYSNICPISGWDEVKVTRVGKNLLSPQNLNSQGTPVVTSNNGVYTVTGTISGYGQVVSSAVIELEAGTYTLNSNGGVESKLAVQLRSVDGLVTYGNSYNYSSTFTLTERTSLKLRIVWQGTTTLNCTLSPQLEVGSTATSYEPYVQPQAITFPVKTISGSAVYGGTLTVERDGTGTLVVDRAFENAKNLTWVTSLTANAFVATDGFKVPPEPHPASEAFVGSSSYGYDNKSYNQLWGGDNVGMAWRSPGSANTQRGIAMRDPKFADLWTSFDLAAFQQAVADLDICYEIAPITYSLTSDQVKTLLGNNTVWADCGAVTVVYYRDITKFIESLLARIEALEG